MIGKRGREHIEAPSNLVCGSSQQSRHATKRTKLSSPQREPSGIPLSELTEFNLRRLDYKNNMPPRRRLSSTPRRPRSQSPSKSSVDMQKLTAYNIFRPGDATRSLSQLPDGLRTLIESFRNKTSAEEAIQLSDRANKIVKLQPVAVRMKEEDGFDALARQLFFQPWAWDSEDFPSINAARRHNLNAGFVPHAPSEMAAQLGTLTTPQPDLMFGYMNNDIVEGFRDGLGEDDEPLPWVAPFTIAEELQCASRRLQVATDVLFPFFTVQWKSARMGQTHVQAQLQGLVDAATIMNANYALDSLIDLDQTHSTNIMCHFSATVDLQTTNLYVHFLSGPDGNEHFEYNTKTLCECNMKEMEAMKTWRWWMRAIYRWAVGPRLMSMKIAVQRLSMLPSELRGCGQSIDTLSTASASNATPSSAATLAHDIFDRQRVAQAPFSLFQDMPNPVATALVPPLSEMMQEQRDEGEVQEEERIAKRKR